MSFVHLCVHSNFSILAGTRTVDDLVGAAARAGMPAMALADTDGLYAVVPFQRACARAGLRPIYGVELTGPWGAGGVHGEEAPFAGKPPAGHAEKDHARPPGEPPARAVLLARSREGYSELCRLVTARHLDPQFSLGRALAGASPNLYILAGDERVLRALAGKANVRAALPVAPGREGARRRWRLRRLASELGMRTVAAGDVYFIDPGEHFVHRILTAIRTRSTVGTLPPREAATPDSYFHAPRQVAASFGDDPQSLRAALELADECRVELDLHSRKLPKFAVPPGEHPVAVLRRLALRGLRDRGLGGAAPAGWGCAAGWERATEVLEYELSVVAGKGLADYFLICWDIVRFARSRAIRSLGRGSAGNSLLSYALGITHVNPLRHNLFFERFLNPEREQLPDFDIDFSTDDREEVLRYIFRRYGAEHVAMIGTYSTLRARAALRETAKALGIPEGEIAPFVRRIPFFASVDHLREVCSISPAAADIPLDREPLRTLLPLAARIGGFPRHMAAHPCGLVVSPEPITDLVPLQRGDKGYEILQWSMHETEEAGFVKIDIIGQKGLAVVQEAAAMAQENEGRPLHPERIDYLSDAAAKQALREGRTEGCFYIESPVMMQLIRQARCDDFEVLTALSSIIRPGVSSYGGKRLYLHRHLGLEPVEVMHPLLAEVLSDTYGCLIYQEQVIRIAVAVGGMSYAQADGLRRCMSYKNRDKETMASYRDSFMRGARDRGVPDDVAREIFRQVASFAGYAFCKAHSASFALESFESIYWKAHYPAEFMAAVLSNGGGYYTQEEYLEEARRMGIEILPPCVNGSRLRHHGRGRTLRIGLMQVRGLTPGTAEAILRGRPFGSLGEFLDRVPASRDEVEALIRCGAMASFGRSRPELLWEMRLRRAGGGDCRRRAPCAAEQRGLVADPAPEAGPCAAAGGLPAGRRRPAGTARAGRRGLEPRGLVAELASEAGGARDPDRLVPRIPDYGLAERVAVERELLGLAVSAHPLAMFRRELEGLERAGPLVRSVDLSRHVGNDVGLVGWKVTVKPTRTMDGGEEMIFATFSDRWGRFEAIFFPDVYRRTAREMVRGHGPFLVRGRVESELGVESLVACDLRMVRPQGGA